MKMKKIVIIGILGLLISTALTSNAITNNEMKMKSDTNDIYIENISTDEKIIKQKTSKTESAIEDFDLFISNSAGWLSPKIGTNSGLICYQIKIDYTGSYNRDIKYSTNINIYTIDKTGNEQFLKSYTDVWGGPTCTHVTPKIYWGGCACKQFKEKPASLKFEFTTTHPEKTEENNIQTVTVDMGVTIYGNVYSKTTSNEKTPVYAKVKCLADDSYFWNDYFSTRAWPEENGSYRVYAPHKSKQKYTIQTIYEGKFKNQTTSKSLDEFECYKMDLIYGKGKSSPILMLKNILERFLEHHPFINSLFKLLRR
jgi:hypothetical protein